MNRGEKVLYLVLALLFGPLIIIGMSDLTVSAWHVLMRNVAK